MADEPEVSQPSARPLAIKINMWNRTALVLLGLVGLGAGGAAVFITHLEAGPVALIVAGLLLLLIGMGGRMPSRLKVGDNEAAWEIEREAMQVFVERVAEEATTESKPELLDALGELAESAPQAAAPGITAVAYEHRIHEEIRRAIEELQASMPGEEPIQFSTEVSADRQRIDAVIEAPDGRMVAIETKFSSKSPSTVWLDLMHQMLSSSSDLRRMLLITRTTMSASFAERLKKYPEIRHVVFSGPQDREELKKALCKVMFG